MENTHENASDAVKQILLDQKLLFDTMEQSKNIDHAIWMQNVNEILIQIQNEKQRQTDCQVIRTLPDGVKKELEQRLVLRGLKLYNPMSCSNDSPVENHQSTADDTTVFSGEKQAKDISDYANGRETKPT